MSSPDRLPSELRDALLAELDPGETLRWCDQPLASRMGRLAIAPAIAISLMVGFLSAMFIALGVQTWIELSDPAVAAARQRGEGLTSAALIIAFGGATAIGGVCALSWPLVVMRRARRTVYALTNTRVFSLVRSSRGTLSSIVCEPGHPLTMSRREHTDGTGDIALYPGAQSPRVALRLAATPDPRTVERLIRTTFDPPS